MFDVNAFKPVSTFNVARS